MSPFHMKVCISVILLALYPVYSNAVNFSQCLADVTSCAINSTSQSCATLNISNTAALSILRTSEGFPVQAGSNPIDTTTGLSLSGCVRYCGKGQEPFSWTVFSQEYSAWLLPYLALLSQLPFGARRRTDNLMSAVLTLGSPTLAGYSLYVTLLNARWLNDRVFSAIDYPNAAVRQSVVQVLSNLQQVPLRVHPGESAEFESLVVHPNNDVWWSTFAAELDNPHKWSIASATSITWVVIAYFLTVADSFSNVAEHLNFNGQGTGTVWLWLLPIVVGWLVLSPKCDYNRVHDAYNKANRRVFLADSSEPGAPPTHVTSNFGLTITPSPDWEFADKNTISPDESRTPPVFNYARALSWSRTAYVTSLFYRAAWRKAINRVGVDGRLIPGNACGDIVPRECRLGNRDQIIRYCRPSDREYTRARVLWPRGVCYNMIVAALMSLQLQWGTTMAAVLVVWYTPTVGPGCRSLTYLMYGAISTIVWFLLVSSSTLGYYAHHLIHDPPTPDLEQPTPSTPLTRCGTVLTIGNIDHCSGLSAGISLHEIRTPEDDAKEDAIAQSDNWGKRGSTNTVEYSHARGMPVKMIVRVADWLRWLGKSLAVINAIGIIAASVFQYSMVYDNCYCNSDVFAWHRFAFVVISPNSADVSLATSAWIGALALALASCIFFVGTIFVVRDSLPS